MGRTALVVTDFAPYPWEHDCPICGHHFNARSDAVYCSNKCRQAALRRRRRNKGATVCQVVALCVVAIVVGNAPAIVNEECGIDAPGICGVLVGSDAR